MSDKILTVEEMLAADDVQYATVDAWGGKVRIGSLSAGDLLDFIDSNDGPAKKSAGLRLIIKSLVDGTGARIGKDEHLQAFRKKDAQVTNKLVAEILKLNGMGEAAKKVLGNESGEVKADASPIA